MGEVEGSSVCTTYHRGCERGRECVRANYMGARSVNSLQESAAREGEGGIAEGSAPVALDGEGGSTSTGQEEGEGVSEWVELVEVDVAGGLAVEEGDGLEGEEEEIGCVGAGVGDRILGPLGEVVDVGAIEEELADVIMRPVSNSNALLFRILSVRGRSQQLEGGLDHAGGTDGVICFRGKISQLFCLQFASMLAYRCLKSQERLQL